MSGGTVQTGLEGAQAPQDRARAAPGASAQSPSGKGDRLVSLFLTVERLIAGKGDMNGALDTLLYYMRKELGVAKAMISLYHASSGKIFLDRSLGFSREEADRILRELFREGPETPASGRGPRLPGKPGGRGRQGPSAPGLPWHAPEDWTGGLVHVPVSRGDRLLGALSAQTRPGDLPGARRLAGELSAMAKLFSGEAGLYMSELIDLPSLEKRLKTLSLELYELKERSRPSSLVSSSPAMQEVYFLLRKVASRRTVVLIQGERGVEKETVAQSLHYDGLKAGGPFVKHDCAGGAAAFSPAAAGRFTDGPEDGEGPGGAPEGGFPPGAAGEASGFPASLLEAAEGGSLFLDSVEALPLAGQARLLQVLRDRAYEKAPGEGPVPADVRVIAGTCADLAQLAAEGRFLRELLYRLNVFPISIPPLREREEDIARLARHFLARYASEAGKGIDSIGPAAMECLRAYRWPGNVAELEDAMRLSVVMHEGGSGAVEPGDLPSAVRSAAGGWASGPSGLDDRLSSMEREMISEALRRRRGNISRAAEDLGVTRRSMGLRMRRLNINYKDFRA
ncbi:MAG: sigma 54-interacting transcriptional regulator [Deltaproteobacteria bacterium]|nr:sigma 54-interacting transcriptional regulator [Deltaproteobacteria bacterium]